MKKAAFLACLCCTLFSCSNVEKKAGEKLQAAREAFERGDYSEAKIQIDSIKILYPKAFETRREGIGLMHQFSEPLSCSMAEPLQFRIRFATLVS